MIASLMERKKFSKIDDCMDIPNLVEIQVKSYEQFLQRRGYQETSQKKYWS